MIRKRRPLRRATAARNCRPSPVTGALRIFVGRCRVSNLLRGTGSSASLLPVPGNGRTPPALSMPVADAGDPLGVQIMGSTADKAAGIANEAIGKAKQGVGKAVGSDKLQAEGAAQELKGDVQIVAGDAKAALNEAANKTADAAKKNL